jgi:hypothetical protein
MSKSRFVASAFIAVFMLSAIASPVAVGKASPLVATLTGAREVPGPGDANGAGTARLRLNVDQRRICYTIDVSRIALPASAAHIHSGGRRVAGSIVVTLGAPGEDGMAEGCATGLAKSLIRAIRDDPARYYVNVHNGPYPDGAVRGQLRMPAPNQ